jgi:hypothetical protein
MVLALFILVTPAFGVADAVEPQGPNVVLLIVAVFVGWAGNLLHRIKKVVKAETDQAIVDYLRTHWIVFSIGLMVSAVAVCVEAATYAKDWGSLLWSALITGFGADSILEAKESQQPG